MDYIAEYEKWLSSDLTDQDTKYELSALAPDEIKERFYRNLEFGTGGLRGKMGAGTNRMNVYTVRKATQGLASYICTYGAEAKNRGVVIAYDSRINSSLFAKECARVFSANGISVYIFESLRPTPELSFAVRHLNTVAGVVITASHNPKEYNGYKVYGSDGGQVAPEAAKEILSFIELVDIFSDVKLEEKASITYIGEAVDKAYIDSVKKESFGGEIPEDFSVLYTPLHGAGNIPVRLVLSEIGVKNVTVVKEQESPDGRFPTVKSPNPENKEAFDIAIERAKKEKVDLVFGTDPDSDRLGVVVPERDGSFTILNGNQTGSLLAEYILRKQSEKGMPERPRVVKTIVTTELVTRIAESYGAEVVNVLTGFKYIGDKIKEYESTGESFLFGLEESYGYLKGTYARDKDAIVAAMLVTELAAECKSLGITLSERLKKIYEKYGYHKERLLSLTLEGIEGIKKIKEIMQRFRTMSRIDGETDRIDYLDRIDGLPQSDVLKFILEDGWIAVRPSGTEPKIKFYLASKGKSEEECNMHLDALEILVNSEIKI